MIETKIKELDEIDVFPALYSSEKRVYNFSKKATPGWEAGGVVMHPKHLFGEYSLAWSPTKYKRMGRGSELTIKFIQE